MAYQQSSPPSLNNCLICGTELEEQKPLVDRETVEKFKSAFRTFCRLLNTNGGDSDDGSTVVEEILNGAISGLWDRSSIPAGVGVEDSLGFSEAVFGLPFCGNCCGSLNEIDRLQKAIDELKADQVARLEGLKLSLTISENVGSFHTPVDNEWMRIRDHLVACVHQPGLLAQSSPSSPRVLKSPRRSSKRGRGDPCTSNDTTVNCLLPPNTSTSGVDVKFSADNLLITSTTESPPSFFPQLQQKESHHLPDPLETSEEEANTQILPDFDNNESPGLRRSTRKRCANTLRDKDEDEEESSSSDEFVPSPESASDDYDEDDEYVPNQRNETTPGTPLIKPAKPQRKSSPVKVKSTSPVVTSNPVVKSKAVMKVDSKSVAASKRPRREPKNIEASNDLFSKVSENLLLFKYTLILLDPSEGLSCQEPGCSLKFLAKGTDYDAFEAMKTHVKTCHLSENEGRAYSKIIRPCPLCPPEATTLKAGNAFLKHLALKHGRRRQYICQSCWKPFQQISQLYPHVRSHLNAEERRAADEQAAIDEQKEGGSRRRKHICDDCGMEFPTSLRFRTHRETHIPKDQRNYRLCDQCPQKFLSPVALQNHKKREHLAPELQQFCKCPICGKKYFQWETHTLKVHVRTHTKEMPFVCDICGRAFPAKEYLRTHQMRVHTEERNYQCQYCEMNYKQAYHLRRHQLASHKDKMPKKEKLPKPAFIGPKLAFPCQFCDKVLPLRCRLTQHMKQYHAGAN